MSPKRFLGSLKNELEIFYTNMGVKQAPFMTPQMADFRNWGLAAV